MNRNKLAAEFLANIGVAWFAAGVIGIFVGKVVDPKEILYSFGYGIILSLAFLYFGSRFLKE